MLNFKSDDLNSLIFFALPESTSPSNSCNSSFAFAVTKALAVLQPCKFFGTYLDPSRLSKNVVGNYVVTETGLRQKSASVKYHLETSTNSETGIVTRFQTAGYQPYAVNYLISQNLDPAIFYYDKMKNLNVQLAYKLGGFTDKANLKILTDSISPGSTSGSQFLPTENYKIYFRTSNPIKKFYYSGVLIEKNSTISDDGSSIAPGYRVTGYDITNPIFKMFIPKRNSNNAVKVQGSVRAKVYKDYLDVVDTVVYGTLFETRQDVVDFLQGYGKWLESEGFKFDRYSIASSSLIFLINLGSNDLFKIRFDKSFIPKIFCLLNPQFFNCEKDNFDTVFALILFLHFFLNLKKTAFAAATLICCPIILLHNEKKISLRVVKIVSKGPLYFAINLDSILSFLDKNFFA